MELPGRELNFEKVELDVPFPSSQPSAPPFFDISEPSHLSLTMSPSILKTTYSFTTPSNPTNAPPPHPSPCLAAELPPPLPTLPTPIPTDHLSDKAEVKR